MEPNRLSESEPDVANFWNFVSLAAEFLPPLDIKEEFLKYVPESLQKLYHQEPAPLFPESKELSEFAKNPEYLSPEEVICHAAVRRARALVNAAQGKLPSSVMQQLAEVAQERIMAENEAKQILDLKESFKTLRNAVGDQISLCDFLRIVLPSVTKRGAKTDSPEADELRLFYWNCHLDQQEIDYIQHMELFGESVAKRSSRPTITEISRAAFIHEAIKLRKSFATHGSVWSAAARKLPDASVKKKTPKSRKSIGLKLQKAKKKKEAADYDKYGMPVTTDIALRRKKGTKME